MTNNSRASNSGMVVSVRGSVVDMRFDAQLPPIYSLLRASVADAHYLRDGLVYSAAINPLLAVLPRAGFIWLLTGGILYSPGIVLFARSPLPRDARGVASVRAGRQHQPQ